MTKTIIIYVTANGTIDSNYSNFKNLKIKDFLNYIVNNEINTPSFHLEKINDYDYLLNLNNKQYEIKLKSKENNLIAKYNYNILIILLLKYQKINHKLSTITIISFFSSLLLPAIIAMILEHIGILLNNLSFFISILVMWLPFVVFQFLENYIENYLISNVNKNIKREIEKNNYNYKIKTLDFFNNKKYDILEIKNLSENKILKKIIKITKNIEKLNEADRIIFSKKINNILLNYKSKIDIIPDFSNKNNIDIKNIKKIEVNILKELKLIEQDISNLEKENLNIDNDNLVSKYENELNFSECSLTHQAKQLKIKK